MASRRIYVTIMVDINNDNIDEIDGNKVADIAAAIAAYYTDNFECEGCEVEAEFCEWHTED